MFDKTALYKQNLYYANLKRENRIKEQMDEMEREKKEMEQLKAQMEQEKLYQIEKKNRIKQSQYEDYNNYLRQKYSTPPQFREKLNIKLGGENRNIKKQNYNEEMDNLCLNPTTQKNIYPTTPIINYSEMGRNYQKGYSHGYNIITGEIYSNPNPNNPNNIAHIKNDNINEKYNEPKNKIENPINYNNMNISPEEYQEFLEYKKLKREKELEEIKRQQYINQYNNKYDNISNNDDNNKGKNIQPIEYENAPNYNQKQNELKYSDNQYEKEMPPSEYQNQQFNREKEEELDRNDNNLNYQINSFKQPIPPYYYNNYKNKDIKENFHYGNEQNDKERIENIYKENIYKQNKFYEDYERRMINKENDIPNNNYPMGGNQEYPPNYYPRKEPIEPNDYDKNKNEIYPPLNNIKNFDNKEGFHQIEKNDYRNIPYNYQKDDNNNNYERSNEKMGENIPSQYQYQQEYNMPPSQYQGETPLRAQYDDNDEIKFRNKLPYFNNEQRENESMNPREEKYNTEKNTNNIKDIERERYMQFLMNKTKENQEKEENNINYNNKEENYPNQNQTKYPSYNNNLEEQYYLQNQQIQNNNFDRNPNYENDYNQQMAIKYNNYISKNEYENEKQRELQGPSIEKYPSYQEQIERIKKEEEYFENEKLKQQNKEIISYNNENNVNNKNAKEIISQFNENKKKNTSSEDHIFKVSPPLPTPPKYNDEPLTLKERKEIQRDYAKYLDWQINEKNARNAKTPFNLKYNPILDDDNLNRNKYEEDFQTIKEKNNYGKDLPINPYSSKNYDYNNKSNLGLNPISYKGNYNK